MVRDSSQPFPAGTRVSWGRDEETMSGGVSSTPVPLLVDSGSQSTAQGCLAPA